MRARILLLSILVGTVAVLYPYLTISRFLGFGAYISIQGGSSIYDTILACHAYSISPPPVSFETKLDCVGPAVGVLLKSVAASIAGEKLEEAVINAWKLWIERR